MPTDALGGAHNEQPSWQAHLVQGSNRRALLMRLRIAIAQVQSLGCLGTEHSLRGGHRFILAER